MYIPKHFKMNEDEVYEFIHANGFAILFSQHNGEPCATHLPLMLDESEHTLYGHFARANEQWKDAEFQQVLAVFQGPHCYISPSWYETEKAVPTWNYVSAHVYGKMELIEDSQTIYDSLHELVTKYENPDSTYDLNDLEPGFIEGMSKGITAFRVKITKIEAKAKLSQNHPVERQERVIKQLENSSQQGDRKIASLMKENLKK
ncbi:protease synthase and sporulation protein PAI 2 [Halobacillus andaensis]|uniref:Protease synthase and sporulation protein PAI 2 n=1 Tax=Halobacillus andaensis TaxID=1176239 RepID=A0A917EXU9_HALAA|nr:FMN-binding negative transcriptional regulator [Halobacillus andaensis]MBP2004355.1 transcriptional regulator [Halobacillus andaensis]GGF22278.1 protease synthase and sporulation protein PAI 2 [Halobacillus andaensis]